MAAVAAQFLGITRIVTVLTPVLAALLCLAAARGVCAFIRWVRHIAPHSQWDRISPDNAVAHAHITKKEILLSGTPSGGILLMYPQSKRQTAATSLTSGRSGSSMSRRC